jgi:hypothetical protein
MPAAVSAAAIKAAIVKILVSIAVNIAVAKVTKALQKKPLRVLQKVDVEYTGGVEPRRRLYGYFRAAGLNVLPAITSGIDLVNGASGVWIHKVLALSDGKIQAIDRVYFNNDAIESSAWTAPNGRVSSGKYANFATVRTYLGDASQTADAVLLTVPGWTTNHRGDNTAYGYTGFYADNKIYDLGAPDVIYEGRGRICYDPRLDTSPGANPTNLTYYAFTTNPALELVDFLMWDAGGAELSGNMIWSDVVAAANICDQSVTVPDGNGGTTTQARFTSSIEVYAPQTTAERDETIRMLARAMLGICWSSGGKWHMRAGAYSSPVGTITDSDFLGDTVDIDTALPRSSGNSFNTLRGSYVIQNQNTQPVGLPEVSVPAYVSADGEKIYGDADFRTARTPYEATRNGILLVRQTRRRIVVAGTFRWRCWQFQVGEIVSVTLSKVGWSVQDAKILRMRPKQNFTVEMELQDIASTDFTDPIIGDYVTPDAIAAPASTTYAPGSVQNFAATGIANGIQFTWSAPLNAPVGTLYRLFEYTSSSPYSSATQKGPDTPQTSLAIAKNDTTTRYYWVVAVDPITLAQGPPSPPSNGLPAAASSASGGLAAVVSPGSATADGFTSSLTTGTVTVSASGGTPGYTYTTTAISGGAGISTNNGTTTTPSWTAAGLAEGDVKSGTYRIRVQDSLGATADVFVAVTITREFGVVVNDTTINATGAAASGFSGGTPAVATYTVANDGSIYPSPGTNYQWKNPSATASDYDVRFTLTSGSIDTGSSAALSTWLSLASASSLVKTKSPSAPAGTDTAVLTVEIRLHATLVVLDSGTLTMNCTT